MPLCAKSTKAFSAAPPWYREGFRFHTSSSFRRSRRFHRMVQRPSLLDPRPNCLRYDQLSICRHQVAALYRCLR